MNGRIIVPLDGSMSAENALTYAEAIPGNTIVLLVCLPSRNDFSASDSGTAENQSLWDSIDSYLDRAASTLIKQGRSVERMIEIGDPAEVILSAAKTDDLIIMTTHGAGAGARSIFGSVADRVTRLARSPVLLVRGGERPVASPPIARIVVSLDGSERAEGALTIAKDLAAKLNIPIRLLRVLDTGMLQKAFRTGTYAAISYAGSVDEIRAVFEVYLEKQANVLAGNGFTVSSAVLDGSAAETLLAALELGDIAVMTSHGRGGVKRWLLGSVADKLIRGATVPVLIARGS